MYTFAYKYGRKISYAPLFVHYTHSGASFACVNARATRGVDQIAWMSTMRRGPGAGPQRAANEQSSITLASPYRMYLFFLSSAPSLLLALGPLCFEGSVGRYFMACRFIRFTRAFGLKTSLHVWIIDSYSKPG